ncbi:MAG TPA: alternative ribosome rescue aminoacyl-tRNA hydrolase ArfB [Aestuariivirgaceae bacterium]|nr:alternative ribosome rescue aminoacyl-tRNA hydrolase ArfB [Aestuariivirgaceae bacterium]
MITISPTLAIDEADITESFIRAAGPGGQNVNKVSTAVELRFRAGQSAAIGPDTFMRLKRIAGRRLSRDGILTIRAQSFRTQERNRADAMARLVELLARAATAPRPRRSTSVPKRSRIRRRDAKARRSATKKLRASPPSVE